MTIEPEVPQASSPARLSAAEFQTLLDAAAAARRDLRQFTPVEPWPLPEKSDCVFYHSIDLPNGETIEAEWDIRGRFANYIGDYPIAGKTLLDVGTASGFLSFEAEKAGAIVTSIDAFTGREFTQLPHIDRPYHTDRQGFIDGTNEHLRMLRNSYWYSWHKTNSRAEVIYAPLADLPFWSQKFDVVLAGAITEHLSDPMTMVGNLAGVAKEAVIIAFDPINDSEEMTLTAGPNWKLSGHEYAFTWYSVSRGLYRQLFDNVGFDVEFVDAWAVPSFAKTTEPVKRTTVVARRRPG